MLRLVTGGLQTTVQDLGRMGHQRSGVPVGGAMDRVALRVGNLLVGNAEGAAAIEASLIGPAITFGQGTLIAVTGGDLEATVDGAALPLWRPVHVPEGATLRFGRPVTGCRPYLSVAGGIDVPVVFGSRSTYLRARFGGVDGRALKTGDVLPLGAPTETTKRIVAALIPNGRMTPASWSAGAALRPRYSEAPVIRFTMGAHTEALSAEAYATLTSAPFRVSSSSDRMGYRLEGPALALRAPLELKSEGVAFGTIQLPPGGAPIILMADRQTTGGYPRVGEVASVDLPLIAQLKPSDRLTLRAISMEEAQRLYLEQEFDLAQARIGISLRHSRGSS
jgi:antagonist of KipI